MGPASGQPSVEGARLAVDEINATGGVKVGTERYLLKLITRPFENRPEAAASAARALINLDSVDIIVGPQISNQAFAAGSVAEASGIPLIAPMASNPSVTRDRKFVFRLAFLDDFQGKLLAQYAYDSLKLRRAGILSDAASQYGGDITKLFTETFEGLGGRVVARETFTTDGGDDFRAELKRILSRSPDALLLPNYAQQDSLQVRQARALGFRGQFLGSDSWDPVSLAHIDEAKGTVLISQWDVRLRRPQSVQFVKRFQAVYAHPPRTTAAQTYDAITLLADAASRAGNFRDGVAWARAIGATSRLQGIVTDYSFHGSGDPVRGGGVAIVGRSGDSTIYISQPLPR